VRSGGFRARRVRPDDVSRRPYRSIDFTETFLATCSSRDFTPAQRRLFLKALRLLDDDERHPSLRVHPLRGDREGSWSASASRDLRMTFERLPDGHRRMLTCSRHYDR
jgi:mRNA-degrading endonuclease YafQ of YafQ-DinJ toxin-antitoxin module